MNPLKANEMPHQEPLVRNKNFLEVATGYDAQTAMDEALRCLHCKHKPCISGCPVQIHIPDFIAKVAEGDFEAAYQIISESSSLPAVCGRVCPQERQCESKCVRGIKGDAVSIGRLERFVADWHNSHCKVWPAVPEQNGHKVAVMELEVNGLKALGVKIVTNVVIGRSMSIDDLFEDGFEAVYIGSGAGLPRFMGIPGESLKEVYSANEYLTRVNLMKAYQPGSTTPIYHARKVAVVGGGNVAMDAARSAIRLGAEEVYVLYRRSFEEIPARQEEVQHAQEEQIRFQTLTNPVEILGSDDGNVTGVRCIRMELGEPDATGRRRPVPVPDSDFVIDADCVIMAIGTSPNPLIKSTTGGLEVNARGGIVADENGRTSRDGVFAGGDTVTGAATVIKAMGAGKIAAKSIDAYIQNR